MIAVRNICELVPFRLLKSKMTTVGIMEKKKMAGVRILEIVLSWPVKALRVLKMSVVFGDLFTRNCEKSKAYVFERVVFLSKHI